MNGQRSFYRLQFQYNLILHDDIDFVPAVKPQAFVQDRQIDLTPELKPTQMYSWQRHSS